MIGGNLASVDEHRRTHWAYAIGQQLTHLHRMWRKPSVEPHGQQTVFRRLERVANIVQTSLIDGDRFFDKHMFASFQGRHNHWSMLVVPCGNEHGIDIFSGQNIVVIRKAMCGTEFPGSMCCVHATCTGNTDQTPTCSLNLRQQDSLRKTTCSD